MFVQMEESKKCNATPTYTSQVSQPSFGANTEIRGPSHTIRMYQSDKPSNPSLTSGGLPNSGLGHVSAANSTSVPPHMLNTDVRASNVSTGIANSHPVDKAQLKVGGGSNGTNYAPQVQGGFSISFITLLALSFGFKNECLFSYSDVLVHKIADFHAWFISFFYNRGRYSNLKRLGNTGVQAQRFCLFI